MLINVEIFHDVERPKQPTKEVYEGLAKIESIIGRLVLINDSRKMKITKPGDLTVDTEKINWPKMPANISIVLTNRLLISGATGANMHGIAFQGRDVVLINTNHPEITPQVTAHEFAHLLEILEQYDDRHCPLTDCIMYSTALSNETRERVDTSTGYKRLKNRLGHPVINSQLIEYGIDFCDGCRSEIAENTHRLMARMALKTMSSLT